MKWKLLWQVARQQPTVAPDCPQRSQRWRMKDDNMLSTLTGWPQTLKTLRTATNPATAKMTDVWLLGSSASYQMAPPWNSTVHLQKSTIVLIHLCRPKAAVNVGPLILSHVQQPPCILYNENRLMSPSDFKMTCKVRIFFFKAGVGNILLESPGKKINYNISRFCNWSGLRGD